MGSLPVWAYGPFELLVHAEEHYQRGQDIDRRMALISFDNAIETAVVTYLALDPLQRQQREYEQAQVGKWLRNFHTKLEFLFDEAQARHATPPFDRPTAIFYHKARNEMYHSGIAVVPNEMCCTGCRATALWAFEFLFDVSDAESLVLEAVAQKELKRDAEFDAYLDDTYEPVRIGNVIYRPSDVVFNTDPMAYEEGRVDFYEEHEAEVAA